MRIHLVFCLMLLVLLHGVSAATIHGTLYDPDLQPIKGAVVTVNTVPLQRTVATDGTYSLTIPSGNYTITTFASNDGETLQAREPVMIQAAGDYTLDLFLFPSTDANTSDLEGLDEDLAALAAYQDTQRPTAYYVALVVLGFCLAAILFWLWRRKSSQRQATMSPDHAPAVDITGKDAPDAIMHILRQSGNRLTQKELRKQLPYSEAKVSLAIAELESNGSIQKIKKGRGNILILK